MQEQAFREIGWNIPYHLLLYPIFLIFFCAFIYGFYRHYKLLKIVKFDLKLSDVGERIKTVLNEAVLQRKLLTGDYLAGSMHLLFFWGYVILFFAGAVMDAIEEHLFKEILHSSYLHGSIYLWHSLLLDIFGILALVGVIIAIFRRYVLKPDKLDRKNEDALILILITVILISGFYIEASRMAAGEIKIHPDWAIWSPVGLVLGRLLMPISESALLVSHRIVWWLHMFLAFFFIAYIPFSKLIHIFFYPANQFMRKLEPGGAIEPILNIEEAETFGVSKIEEMKFKQLFDLESCIRCGRCQEYCPAYITEKPLSPKDLIQDTKGHWSIVGKQIVKSRAPQEIERKNLIGDVIKEDTLWSCTTCRQCEEECPSFVGHIQEIIDLRRNLVLMESKFPSEVNTVFKGMENQGNPWGIGSHTRADWAKDLNVKTLSEESNVEYLFFVGCSASFDARNRKIAASFVNILDKAGVSFGILGVEETCCGDSARRIGNEYLFQILAQANIETMKNYNVKKIITTCPHGYNTLKNEYPQFGGKFEVFHHTEIILDLIKHGKLKINKNLDKKITLHDSCYLGRYNNIYEEPRKILSSIRGVRILEPARTRTRSFCCGAGGGRMWMEETLGRRINFERTEQILKLSPDELVTCCPFCLTMFDEGIKQKNQEEKIKLHDIAEVVDGLL